MAAYLVLRSVSKRVTDPPELRTITHTYTMVAAVTAMV